jgi:ProP effector
MHADLPESPDLPETSEEATGPAPNEAVPASVELVDAASDVALPAEPMKAAADGTSPAEPAKAAADSMSPAEPAKAAVDSMSPAACGAKLAELFPALFHPATADAPPPVKPLKLRIQGDILERAPGVFTKRILGIYFSRYTTSNAYLKALTQAPSRFDLDGNPVGEIDIVHRTAAVEELARRRDIAQAKRAELHKAQRQAAQATQNVQGPAAPTQGEGASAPQREGVREARRDAPRNPRRDAPREAQRPAGDEGRRDQTRDRPRGPRPDRAPHQGADRAPRPDHANRMDRPARPAQHNDRAEPATPSLPADPAQRERALLLRSFEASPLSKANFCALKRISETDLDAQLAQARAERTGGPAKRA